jgi:hypothetical protein
MLTIVLLWFYFHFRFLNVPPLHIDKRLEEMEAKQKSNYDTNDKVGLAIIKAKYLLEEEEEDKKESLFYRT